MKLYKPTIKLPVRTINTCLWISFLFGVISPQTIFAHNQVSFQVEGQIKARCAFDEDLGQVRDVSQTALSFDVHPDQSNWTLKSNSVALSLTCNAPFTLAVSSNLGGLTNEGADRNAIGGNFTNQIVYQANLKMTTENASTPVFLSCQSKDMEDGKSSCIASSHGEAAIGAGSGVGSLTISLSDRAGYPIQGHYQDTIVIALALQ
jgi:hypothetical protein